MQVRASNAAGGPDSAQRVTHADMVARFHRNGAQVAHHAQQAPAVVDPYRAAIEEIVTRVDHLTRQWGHHGGAGGGGNVHAAMRIARLPVEHPPQPE